MNLKKIVCGTILLAGLACLSGCKVMFVPYFHTEHPVYSRNDAVMEYLLERRQRKELYQGIKQQDKSESKSNEKHSSSTSW